MRNGGSFLLSLILLFGSFGVQANTNLWQEVSAAERSLSSDHFSGRHFKADELSLKMSLFNAPHERVGDQSYEVELPMPNGSLQRFAVVESPILDDAGTALWPEFKTFKVYGIDDPNAYGRLSHTAAGFHGMMRTLRGVVYIDPVSSGTETLYTSRYRSRSIGHTFSCGVSAAHDPLGHLKQDLRTYAARTEGSMQEYRLAVAVTREYYDSPGPGNGNLGDTVAAITTTVNRVNMIYEDALGITFTLVGTAGQIYETGDDGLDNESASNLLPNVTPYINNRLGAGAYDIGHIFTKPSSGGGIAYLGVVCDANFKGGGVTGLPNPTGQQFDIDFVAHEIGHQFNADHSFNGTANACGQRNASTAYEPGSGSTIMAYAGICGAENIETFSDVAFHAGSVDQIDAFAWNGAGATCAATNVIMPANSDPVIATPTPDYTIPIQTPFALDNATASDPDVDAMTYQWDQLDAGLATTAATFGTDLGTNALFRSYEPRSQSYRNFPGLRTQLNNEYDDAEVLPCKARQINMRLTVRDNNSGSASDDVRVTSTTTSGPFRVTSQTTAATLVPLSGAINVTWDVANTTSAPVSCAAVDIELLTFDVTRGSYSVQAMNPAVVATANDGNEMVTLPDISNAISRIRVKCSDNIFYDLSDADLNINGTGGAVTYDMQVQAANPQTTDSTPPNCPVITTNTPSSSSSSGGDSGSIEMWWLFALTALAGLIKWSRRQG